MGIKIQWLLCAILITVAIIPAFADDIWLVAETDKTQYHTGELLNVTGYILERKMPVIAMSVYDPDGVILSANNVELGEDDSFSKTTSLDSPFYDKPGIYTIDFDYGKQTEQLTFEIESQLPQTPQTPIPEITPEVIFVTTDKESYQNNEMITISGAVSVVGDPTILVGIYDPNDMPAGFYTPQIDSNLEFSVSFPAKNGINFKTFGMYSVKAHYGTSKATTGFSFIDTISTNQPTESKAQDALTDSALPQTETVNKPKTNTQSDNNLHKITEVMSNPSPEVTNLQSADNTKDDHVGYSDNLSVEDEELGKMLNEIILNCDTSEYTDSISYYDGMGPALMRLCNYDQAIAYFDQSLIETPTDVGVITNKGSAMGKLGDLKAAVAYYDMALDIDPTYLPAMNNKANALAEQGNVDQAIKIYDTILKQDPSYEIAQNNLQKAQKNLDIHTSTNQQASLIAVDYPIEKPFEIESTNTVTGQPDIHASNILEQIGSAFAGLFGFLK